MWLYYQLHIVISLEHCIQIKLFNSVRLSHVQYVSSHSQINNLKLQLRCPDHFILDIPQLHSLLLVQYQEFTIVDDQ